MRVSSLFVALGLSGLVSFRLDPPSRMDVVALGLHRPLVPSWLPGDVEYQDEKVSLCKQTRATNLILWRLGTEGMRKKSETWMNQEDREASRFGREGAPRISRHPDCMAICHRYYIRVCINRDEDSSSSSSSSKVRPVS